MLIAGLPSNSVRGLSNTPKLSPMDEGPEQSEQPDSPEVSSRENKYKAKTSIYLSIYKKPRYKKNLLIENIIMSSVHWPFIRTRFHCILFLAFGKNDTQTTQRLVESAQRGKQAQTP